MITKRYQIRFADPQLRASDCIRDLRDAVKSARLNLYSRYAIQLEYPMLTRDNQVEVEVRIPEDLADGFSKGYRLRGLSNYLLKNCNDKYKEHKVGDRLLEYVDVTDSNAAGIETPQIDRFQALVDFARLLERSDDEALDQVDRILVILRESRKPWE